MPVRCALLLLLTASAAAAHIVEVRRSIAGFTTGLTIPTTGIRAREPVELFIRIVDSDAGLDKPETGVPCQDLTARILMPAMPGMPPLVPVVRSLGYAGSYSIRAVFPHGGAYRLTLRFSPSSAPVPIESAYLLEVSDENTAPSAWRPFDLRVASAPVRIAVGRPVRLSLSVWARDTGERVREFDVVHEKLLHLIVVRDDLGSFFHEHPILQADGTFSLEFAFPSAGTWQLFADMAPAGAGAQVALASVKIDGAPPPRQELTPASLLVAKGADSILTMAPAEVIARTPEMLVFTLRDSRGDPVQDLDLWLGARAHLILIESDATTFVHSHVEENAGSVDSAGQLVFQTRFPKPGLYRAWMQFQRNGKIVTLTFVLRCA